MTPQQAARPDAALVGDGCWDGVSWLTLAPPVLLYFFFVLRRRRGSRA